MVMSSRIARSIFPNPLLMTSVQHASRIRFSSGVPRCLTPISYRIHQDRFVPARGALEGALFEARSLRRDACNPHVFAACRTRTACDWKLGLRCVHGYYPHGRDWNKLAPARASGSARSVDRNAGPSLERPHTGGDIRRNPSAPILWRRTSLTLTEHRAIGLKCLHRDREKSVQYCSRKQIRSPHS